MLHILTFDNEPVNSSYCSFKDSLEVSDGLKILTSGSGQQPHLWVEAMKQQVVDWGQLVWPSHWTLPCTSLLSFSSSSSHFSSSCISCTVITSSSSGSFCSSSVDTVLVWVVRAAVVGATVVNAGVFSFIGVEPEVLWQVRVVTSQVVPEGQQCSWSSQHTAFYTKWLFQSQTSSQNCMYLCVYLD